MAERFVYPFTAIVGQERMRTALLLHAVDPRLGGVLITGEKGTAKSTAVRSLGNLLPSFSAVLGCPFGCDQSNADTACEACAERLARGETLPAFERPVPVVELPIGATEDRVLGSLDLERAIQSGERHFEPGLLARAHRGILYVDEVNLLGDHLVDILLDAAAMGRNYVEREGISFSHPASFMLIGTMNPEEGDLRPQLLDRFALVVEVKGLLDPLERAEVVRRRIAFESDPRGFARAWAETEQRERRRLERARALLPSVRVPETMLELIVQICVAFAVDGMRADLAIYRAASALAAYAERETVEQEDVRTAAELALPHRRRRQPFEQPGLDQERLDEVMNDANARQESERRPPDDGGPEPTEGELARAGSGDNGGGTSKPAAATRQQPGPAPDRLAAPAQPPLLALPAARAQRGRPRQSSGRGTANNRAETGKPGGVAPPSGPQFELALAATLRAAAPYQQSRRRSDGALLMQLRPGDLRARSRRARSRSLVLFVVDASGSMGARDRMSATKAAILGLLLDAYRKRDRVGLVAFRGRDAELLLPPTNSVELAERQLRSLPTGGRTPLASGLFLATATVERALKGSPLSPLLVLVSDGRANAAVGGGNPWQAALREADRIRLRGWPAMVVDADRGRNGMGFARALATALGADHLPLDSLRFAGTGRVPPDFKQNRDGRHRMSMIARRAPGENA